MIPFDRYISELPIINYKRKSDFGTFAAYQEFSIPKSTKNFKNPFSLLIGIFNLEKKIFTMCL